MSFPAKYALALMASLPFAVNACLDEDKSPMQASDVPAGTVDLRVQLAPPEFGYQISSTTHIVKAGTEEHFCDLVRIDPVADEKLIWINGFESRTSNFTHHMNVHVGTFSVIDAFLVEGGGEKLLGLEVGAHRCDEYGDMMEQGIFPVYPSQNTHQTAQLPAGVAIPGIAPLLMIMEHHYINTTDKDVMINAKVNFHRVEQNQVEQMLTGFFGIGSPIEIPGNSSKIHTWTCAIERDVTMVAISSHAHARQDCFTMNQYDRDTSAVNDTPFFVNPSWDQPPIVWYEPDSWQLRAGDGVHWACHYRNPEARTVFDGGSASDEMCIFVGVGYPSLFTVQDVVDMVNDPLSVDLETLMDRAIIDCNDVTTATSPWPDANQALPEKPLDDCGGFEPTLAEPVEAHEH